VALISSITAEGKQERNEHEVPGFPTLSFNRAGRFGGLGQYLGHEDALACLEIIHRSLSCITRKELSALVGGLGDLLEADFCACLLSSRAPAHTANRLLIVEGTFPLEWLKLYGERQFHLVDPIVAENFSSFSLQYWSDTYSRRPPPKIFSYLAEDFGLKNGFSFGIRNAHSDGGSLFSFSGPRLKRTTRNQAIQDLVLPHLHQALCQLDGGGGLQATSAPALSSREREVLKWIGVGKSSWETGMILKISERTVNFHLGNIMRKLDAVNRPQAVAMALKLGLLELP
jgi:DNA-binding CsgD family transcriptional regulator